ncbi:MAG: hypothetical protein KH082_08465, partial [Bifidobacterium longum]|nr:hypothetical protein [Bifidobacterium longum]
MRKRAEIGYRDRKIWPGSHVNRLTWPPGQKYAADAPLLLLQGFETDVVAVEQSAQLELVD